MLVLTYKNIHNHSTTKDMPRFYFFDIDSGGYSSYFPSQYADVINKLYDCHKWVERDGMELDDFIEEIKDIHLDNLKKLEKKIKISEYFKLIPNIGQSNAIFEKMKDVINENDIISIYSYRGCGQYYVYGDNGTLKITSHAEEYGRSYPPEASEYYFSNKLHNLLEDDSIDTHYDKIDVFYEYHRKKYTSSREYGPNENGLSICASGVYIDTKKYLVIRSDGKILHRHKYIKISSINFCDDEYELTIIHRENKDKITLRCGYYESDEKY